MHSLVLPLPHVTSLASAELARTLSPDRTKGPQGDYMLNRLSVRGFLRDLQETVLLQLDSLPYFVPD
jgi:hypothetical protein